MPGLAWILFAALVAGVPAPAHAQLFFSSQPAPAQSIGPLIVRASLSPEMGPARVSILFGVVTPPAFDPGDAPRDLYLLWPGEVQHDPALGERDAALARYVEERGFDVIGEGRVALFAQRQQSTEGEPPAEGIRGGAPFVTFVQTGGSLGLSRPASWIRIPWTPRFTDPGWLLDLRMVSRSLVTPRTGRWIETVLLGPRYLFTMTFNEVRDRPLFAMYLAHRDRVVRLADAPAELAVNFAAAPRVKIDQVYPLNTVRRLSETLESTEVVSLFLDTSDRIVPQQLSVQFGYFSRTQSALVVAIPLVLLALGYAVGPLVGRLAGHLGRHLAARIHLGGWHAAPRERERGVILGRETLARIRPGETTFEDVLRLCGSDCEVSERLGQPARRTVVYRGERVRPQTRRLIGWLSTVRYWEVERHEVTIECEGDGVRDVQVGVRRSRVPVGEGA